MSDNPIAFLMTGNAPRTGEEQTAWEREIDELLARLDAGIGEEQREMRAVLARLRETLMQGHTDKAVNAMLDRAALELPGLEERADQLMRHYGL